MQTSGGYPRGEGLVGKKVQRVEDDRFGKGDRQNRLHQNWGRRAGIAPDRRGRPQASKADSYPRAHGCKSHVNASAHLCQ